MELQVWDYSTLTWEWRWEEAPGVFTSWNLVAHAAVRSAQLPLERLGRWKLLRPAVFRDLWNLSPESSLLNILVKSFILSSYVIEHILKS
jgi:hypothetical protein